MALLKLSGSILCHPPNGKFPSVSINNNGTIVQVYQPHILSNEIYYQVYQLNGDEIKVSGGKDRVDYGRYPKVAINNENQVIEVHEGRVHRYIHYSIGQIKRGDNTTTTTWHAHGIRLCRGRFPAVAVYGNRVVITYDRAYGPYTSYYCVGKFVAGGTGIKWGQENCKLFKSYGTAETSVAINEENVIVAGRGWNSIICRVGRFHDDTIQFNMDDHAFGYLGYSPSVCLDNDGYIVMVWQSFTLRKLNYKTGKIPAPAQPTITWAQNTHLRSYGYGYNPTIAISPNGTNVLEEHETNYAPLNRCRLYYQTGIQEKPQHQGQPPQQGQAQPPHDQGQAQPPHDQGQAHQQPPQAEDVPQQDQEQGQPPQPEEVQPPHEMQEQVQEQQMQGEGQPEQAAPQPQGQEVPHEPELAAEQAQAFAQQQQQNVNQMQQPDEAVFELEERRQNN